MVSPTEQELLICQIKFAEQMERYEDAIDLLNDMIGKGIELGHEGRNLLSVAYKSVLSARRYSWRVLAAYENKPGANESERKMAKDYREVVAEEYRNTCNTLVKMLDQDLLPKAKELETKIYLLKMKADYHRYIAEITLDESKTPFAEESAKAYDEATVLARENIEPTHPLRMGLALNHAVYYYEIKKDVEKACSIARQAYTEARPDLVELGNDDTKEKKESLLILQLLQDNLTKWMGMAAATDEDQKENVDANNREE